LTPIDSYYYSVHKSIEIQLPKNEQFMRYFTFYIKL